MSQLTSAENFINSIIKNLENNGFPKKKVSLPVEKMYEIADDKGLNFNTILKTLNDEHGIDSEIAIEKVIFSKAQPEVPNPFGNMDFSKFESMDKNELMKQAQEMMASMSPEQMNSMKETFESMPTDQQEELMKKGKDMGIE